MPQAAARIRKAAERNPKERLTALFHHITPDALHRAFHALKRDAAAGVDGVTWNKYGEGLEERLLDLHRRLHTWGAYRAPPVQRVEIPKPDGGTRPLGIAALEDKIVQKAGVDVILTPIYEVEFLGFSYGFRPGRGAHDALDALAFGIERRKVSWIVDADIRAYFDTIQREYFFQFGLVEAGIFHLVHQLVLWLQRAAEGTLIDPEQGWEPVLRRDLSNLLVIDAEACRAIVDRPGGYRVLKAGFYRPGLEDARFSDGATAIVQSGRDTVPLKRGDKELLTSRREKEGAFGNTVCCVIWPDKLASGAPRICDRYMPETVTTIDALRHRTDELGSRRALDAFLSSLERCFTDMY